MEEDVLYVFNSQELNLLIEKKNYKELKKYRSIKLLCPLPGTETTTLLLENKINKSLKACGCEYGAVFMISSLFICIAWVQFFNPNRWALHLTEILVLIFFLVFSTIIGKIIGLYLAKTQFLKTLKLIQKFYNQPLKYINDATM